MCGPPTLRQRVPAAIAFNKTTPPRRGSENPKRDRVHRHSNRDGENYAASRAGTGNAVTDLIFSMANLDVTFFNATAPISFL
jgi:hypothetical protein